MSLKGSLEKTQLPMLRGRISEILVVDKTLTLAGACADAEAVGNAIRESMQGIQEAKDAASQANTVGTQAGQAAASAAALAAKAEADAAVAKARADESYDAAVIAQENAENAMEEAKAAGSKIRHRTTSVSLFANNWTNNKQTAAAEGITVDTDLIVCPAPESNLVYTEAGIYCSAQRNGELEFSCREQPELNVNANILILL